MKQKGSAEKEERKEVGRRLYYFVKHHLAEKKIHEVNQNRPLQLTS